VESFLAAPRSGTERGITPDPAAAPPRRQSRRRPRRGFAKGAAIGALVLIPLLTSIVYIAVRLQHPQEIPTLIEVLRLAGIFAGLPIVITAGGVGRLSAQASLDGGRPRAAWIGGRTLAIAGAGLVLLAAIPNAAIPSDRLGWGLLAFAGAIGGAAIGALVGLACGGPMPTLVDLGVWPPDASVARVVEHVVNRTIRRRRETSAPPRSDRPSE
jgi:hypothetical protein